MNFEKSIVSIRAPYGENRLICLFRVDKQHINGAIEGEHVDENGVGTGFYTAYNITEVLVAKYTLSANKWGTTT